MSFVYKYSTHRAYCLYVHRQNLRNSIPSHPSIHQTYSIFITQQISTFAVILIDSYFYVTFLLSHSTQTALIYVILLDAILYRTIHAQMLQMWLIELEVRRVNRSKREDRCKSGSCCDSFDIVSMA